MKLRILKAGLGVALMCCLATGAAAQGLDGTLKKIKESGTISIGYNERSVPFSYIGDTGQPVGFTIDLCLAFADAVKKELALDKLEIKYVLLSSTTLIPLLTNGTVDMVCTITTMTLSRRRQVDFLSITYIAATKFWSRKARASMRWRI